MSLSQSPTVLSGTTAGTIVGQPPTCLPSRRAAAVDNRRSDIWAFGCVFYEMLAGKPVFEGETTVEILSATLRGEPDWTQLPPTTPAHIRLLKRCLDRDRRQRLRDIADIRFQIEDALYEFPVTPTVERASRDRMHSCGRFQLQPLYAAISLKNFVGHSTGNGCG